MEKITAKDNEKIKRYAKILSSKKYRDALCLFAIEGVKLFKEAKRCSVEIEQIFVTEKFLNRFGEDFFADENCEVYQISEAVENKIASSLTPQGIYAICKKLDKPLKKVIILLLPIKWHKLNIGELCNGSTTDSDSVCWGSNPYSSAKRTTHHLGWVVLFLF